MTRETTTITGGTKIEWADFTFNPWWGCEKISPGCAHCYADTQAKRYAPGDNLWGAGHQFRYFGQNHWDEPKKWARLAPAKLGRRPRVFCASMADVFEDNGGIRLEGQRRRLFGEILRTPELDWLVLTKRPEFARDWLPVVEEFALFEQWPIPNLWMGVSIENSRFTWRADVLREIPAAVRFISAEPLLGSLFEDARSPRPTVTPTLDERRRVRAPLNLTEVDWLIIGGESGPGARLMQSEWAEELLSACEGTATVPFVKQFGKVLGRELGCTDSKGGNWDEWPDHLRVRGFPASSLGTLGGGWPASDGGTGADGLGGSS